MDIWITMIISTLVTCSVICAGISVILQTTSCIIPGWLIFQAKDFSLSMGLWYVIFCETNTTEALSKCDHFSYNGFVSERNEVSLSHLRKYGVVFPVHVKAKGSYWRAVQL